MKTETTTNNNKKAVIYCRVSTKEQVDEGNSLVTQERLCREYANKQGYEISEVFIEKGESAKTANRKQLKLLLKVCTSKRRNIKAVIVYKIDRMSRNTEDYLVIRGTLKRYSVEIKSVTEFFEDTPAGRFMESIIANVGQFDNDVRAERCIGGMRDAAEIYGRYVWMAPPGYSNVKIDKKSTIAPNSIAHLVKRAFELVASRLYSTATVHEMLAKEGLVNRNGKPMPLSNFYKMLRNTLYKGVITKFGKQYQGTFEALIPETLFDTVQDILDGKKNVVLRYRPENPDFPLRRFVKDETGETITGYWSQGKRLKYPYYAFKKKGITIRKELLEDAFLKLIGKYEFDNTTFKRLAEHLTDFYGNQKRNTISSIEQISQSIAEINKEIDILLSLVGNGTIRNATFKTRIKQKEDQLLKLEQELQKSSTNQHNIPALLRTARKLLMRPDTFWAKSTFKIRLKLQVFYFPEGLIFDGKNYQTPKICSIFKVKDIFVNRNSLLVPSKSAKTNTSFREEHLPLLENWSLCKSVLDDLVTIDKIARENCSGNENH